MKRRRKLRSIYYLHQERMNERTTNIKIIDSQRDDIDAELGQLRDVLSPRGDVVSEAGRRRTIEAFGEPLSPQQVVERICRDVEQNGLPSLLDYTNRIDGVELDAASVRVSQEEMQAAHANASQDLLETVRAVRDNILHFQRAILHQDVTVRREPGLTMTQRYVPLQRVGVCVPGGAAAYPSSILMAAVPAMAAGVEEIAVVAPPTPFGANNSDVMAVCHELGIGELYRIGGAQAVASLAYGVEGLPAVDKIVGPGNLFVALAKQLVYGTVDIDSIAGPSEVVVIADQTYDPEYAASDLLAQAEHSPGASILVTWDKQFLDETAAALERQVQQLERCELTLDSLANYGYMIRVENEAEACRVTDLIAPEHLQIATENAEEMARTIRNAGATFIGSFSPVAMGDYVAGPSHVLPTSGTARWAGGLCANDFLRSGSLIEYTAEGMAIDAPHVRQLATREGLTAHRASVEVRLPQGN